MMRDVGVSSPKYFEQNLKGTLYIRINKMICKCAFGKTFRAMFGMTPVSLVCSCIREDGAAQTQKRK